MLDKAQTQLDDTRHSVASAAHNFEMLEQSLEDRLAQDKAEFATALGAKKADLAEAEKSWKHCGIPGCKQMQLRLSGLGPRGFKAFAEELKALANANQVLQFFR